MSCNNKLGNIIDFEYRKYNLEKKIDENLLKKIRTSNEVNVFNFKRNDCGFLFDLRDVIRKYNINVILMSRSLYDYFNLIVIDYNFNRFCDREAFISDQLYDDEFIFFNNFIQYENINGVIPIELLNPDQICYNMSIKTRRKRIFNELLKD